MNTLNGEWKQSGVSYFDKDNKEIVIRYHTSIDGDGKKHYNHHPNHNIYKMYGLYDNKEYKVFLNDTGNYFVKEI